MSSESIALRIDSGIAASIRGIESLRTLMPQLCDAVALMVDVLNGGGCVMTAGNGGSAAEAMHMSEELVGRFRTNRRSLPGVALVADGTALTCIANDFGFDAVFSRQVEGLGKAGDLLVLFSTSGAATNLKRAAEVARRKGMKILGLLGRDGGALAGCCDVELIVSGTETEHIQEAHQVILHILLNEIEIAFPMSHGERGV